MFDCRYFSYFFQFSELINFLRSSVKYLTLGTFAIFMFCQETLLNHKKIINTKLSAVSSFYIWSMKRGYVKYHPFDGKLDRMKKANEEKISFFRISSHSDINSLATFPKTTSVRYPSFSHKSTETTRSFYCRPKSKSEVMDKINALKAKQSEKN